MHKIVLWIQGVLVPALGAPGTFVVAFLDSSFLSIPEVNDIMCVTAAARDARTAWLYVLMTALGSLAGCLLIWALARRGGEAFLVKRFGASRVAHTRAAFERWGVLALAVPALLPPPMPFKIFVLSAGVFGYPWKRLAVTVFLARVVRGAVWAAAGAVYGDEALALLRVSDAWFARHLPAVLGVCAAALVVGLGLWAMRRRGRTRAPGLP